MLSEADKIAINQAIQEAEKRSGGEIVTVIDAQSGAYGSYSLQISLLASLLTPLFLWYAADIHAFPVLWVSQLGALATCECILRLTGWHMPYVPNRVKQEKAACNAHAQFYRHGIHTLENRSGILLFVSVSEHYVELMADSGIYGKEPAVVWQGVVETFIGDVKAGRIRQGFIQAIKTCGDMQSRHFPPLPGKENIMSDHIQVQ